MRCSGLGGQGCRDGRQSSALIHFENGRFHLPDPAVNLWRVGVDEKTRYLTAEAAGLSALKEFVRLVTVEGASW